jgi:hypothetical protein
VTLALEDLMPCFQGVAPGYVATCSKDGEPNITPLSQVHYVDARHVALSCQFFNKTKRNVLEHPFATVQMYDPATFRAYRLRLRYDHAETEGPLFESMSLRIQVIASHTGMAGIFRLLSADVYEVLSVEPVAGYIAEPDALPAEPAGPTTDGFRNELRALQSICERINRAEDLSTLLSVTLDALDTLFGFTHTIVFLADDAAERLTAVASRGYEQSAVGGQVAVGEGLVGAVAAQRRLLRLSGMDAELRYGRAVRDRTREVEGTGALCAEVPLPGLPDVGSRLVLPLTAGERLVGVLAVESPDPLAFDEWDEAFLDIVGRQIASGLDNLLLRDASGRGRDALLRLLWSDPQVTRPARTFVFYRNDDCVFVDGEYLIRNVPGKILWKLLTTHEREGRREFCNRELRLDPSLGLPPVKDNLESRLILLRKRLEERCPDVRLVPTRRGRFTLELACRPALFEKDGTDTP